MRNVGKTCGGKLITNSSCRTSSHIVEPNNPKLDANIHFVESNPRVLVPGVCDEDAHHLPRFLDLNYSQRNSTEVFFPWIVITSYPWFYYKYDWFDRLTHDCFRFLFEAWVSKNKLDSKQGRLAKLRRSLENMYKFWMNVYIKQWFMDWNSLKTN